MNRAVLGAVAAILMASGAAAAQTPSFVAPVRDPSRWQFGLAVGPAGTSEADIARWGIDVTATIGRRFARIRSMRGDVGRGHWELAAPHVPSETLTLRRVTVGIVRRFEGLTEGPLRPYLHGGIGAYGYSFDVASQESTTRTGVHGGFGMEFLFKDNRMAVTSEVAVRGV